MKHRLYELKDFSILWGTRGLSQLGSMYMHCFHVICGNMLLILKAICLR